MSDKSLQKWLEEREPGIPAPFLPHLMGDVSGTAVVEELAALGEEALCRALARPGRERAAAFDLLTADAFLTYACEWALTKEDLEGALEDILYRLGERLG